MVVKLRSTVECAKVDIRTTDICAALMRQQKVSSVRKSISDDLRDDRGCSWMMISCGFFWQGKNSCNSVFLGSGEGERL